MEQCVENIKSEADPGKNDKPRQNDVEQYSHYLSISVGTIYYAKQ